MWCHRFATFRANLASKRNCNGCLVFVSILATLPQCMSTRAGECPLYVEYYVKMSTKVVFMFFSQSTAYIEFDREPEQGRNQVARAVVLALRMRSIRNMMTMPLRDDDCDEAEAGLRRTSHSAPTISARADAHVNFLKYNKMSVPQVKPPEEYERTVVPITITHVRHNNMYRAHEYHVSVVTYLLLM